MNVARIKQVLLSSGSSTSYDADSISRVKYVSVTLAILLNV